MGAGDRRAIRCPGHDGHGFGHGTLYDQPFPHGTLWDHGSPSPQVTRPFAPLPTTPAVAHPWPSKPMAPHIMTGVVRPLAISPHTCPAALIPGPPLTAERPGPPGPPGSAADERRCSIQLPGGRPTE